jgi:hypothetical protein
MTDVHHSGVPDFVACKKVSASKTAEGYREICARRPMHDAREEIDTCRAIHGDYRNVEIMYAVEESGDSGTRGAPGSSAEQRIDCQADRGPGSVG